MKREYWILILFFCLISLAKIIISLRFSSPHILADEVLYFEKAKDIFLTKSLFGKTDAFLLPGYPLILSISFLFSEKKIEIYHTMLIINCLLTSSIIFPSYFILGRYSSSKISLLGSLIISIIPSTTVYIGTLMSENLFIPLFMFSLWFLIKAYESDHWFWTLLAFSSVLFLLSTRATGIACVFGYVFSIAFFSFYYKFSKNFYSAFANKHIAMSAIFLPILAVIFYLLFFTNSSFVGYSTIDYTNSLRAIININMFLTIMIMLVHEISAIILASYFIVFFLAFSFVYTMFKQENFLRIFGKAKFLLTENPAITKPATIYVLTSSTIMLSMIIIHMIQASLYQYAGVSQGLQVYMRYLDPFIPIIFLFGFIALGNLDLKRNENFRLVLKLTLIYVAATGIILCTFPTSLYRISNTLSIIYIQEIGAIISAKLLIIIISAIALALFLLSFWKRIFHNILLLFIIINSLLSLSIAFNIELYNSEFWLNEYYNPIGSYLYNHSEEDTYIIIDNNDVLRDPYLEDMIVFWSNGKIDITNSTIAREKLFENQTYVISSSMPFDIPPICCSRKFYCLYNKYTLTDCEIVLKDGWYERENWGGMPAWWMKNDSEIDLYSLKGMKGELSFQVFSEDPKTLEIFVGDFLIERKNIPASNGFLLPISLPINLTMGANKIILHLPEGCRQAASDSRCLGIAVQNMTISIGDKSCSAY